MWRYLLVFGLLVLAAFWYRKVKVHPDTLLGDRYVWAEHVQIRKANGANEEHFRYSAVDGEKWRLEVEGRGKMIVWVFDGEKLVSTAPGQQSISHPSSELKAWVRAYFKDVREDANGIAKIDIQLDTPGAIATAWVEQKRRIPLQITQSSKGVFQKNVYQWLDDKLIKGSWFNASNVRPMMANEFRDKIKQQLRNLKF